MMDNKITDKEMKILLKAQQGELDAVAMYNALADVAKDKRDAEAFKTLASDEGRHAAVFKGMTGKVLKPKKTKAVLLPMLYKCIGKKNLYPLIAKGEYDAAKAYMPVVERFPEIESVMKDETRHGDIMMSLLEEPEA